MGDSSDFIKRPFWQGGVRGGNGKRTPRQILRWEAWLLSVVATPAHRNVEVHRDPF